MRKTKIICTIGPACDDKETLISMIESGMDIARLNFSHGDHTEHHNRISTIKTAFSELGHYSSILLDTRGPEIRLGSFTEGQVKLEQGQIFTLKTEEIHGDAKKVYITYPNITQDVSPGDVILLDDGLVELEVQEVYQNEVKTVVKNEGMVKDKKGVNLPGVKVSLPALTEKDKADISFAVENELDFIAASFIRKPEDVLEIRKHLEALNSDIPIIAKIENKEGVENISSILEVSDGLMVARGDLGVDIPPEEVPGVQKRMIKACNREGKPVITATQMLESMTENPRPTRAEASDVANAIIDGTDAVMLSGETAIGKYPVDSVATMARIAITTEKDLPKQISSLNRDNHIDAGITEAIGYSTCQIALQLGADAILTATQSGYTARMVSKHKPGVPIIAVTPERKVVSRLALSWGVYPVKSNASDNTDEMFQESIQSSLKANYIKEGNLIVITAGVPVGVPGSTNLIRVHTVGEVILSGSGIGKQPITGRVIKIWDEKDAQNVIQGDIVVLHGTTEEIVPYLSKAGGLVAEEGGYTSPSAIVGLELGIPVIVGAGGALEKLEEGEIITLDSQRGLVYRGKATIL